MNELNEQELERIIGGEGKGEAFSSADWSKRNCRECANTSTCRNKNAYIANARQKAKNGVEWNCPSKC